MALLKKLSIFFCILLISQSVFAQQQDYKEITVEDIWRYYTFYPKSVYGLRSMNDGEHYTALEGGIKIVKYSFESGDKIRDIFNIERVPGSDLDAIDDDYQFSRDETKILFFSNSQRIYRRSFKADYYVWDTIAKTLTPVSEKGMQQLADFSPDGSKVAFVRDNNLFIKDLEAGDEKQITDDGEFNRIINGAPDWVYEEEFEFAKGFHWSPDGQKIAYYKFDESDVRQFSMSMFKGMAPAIEDNKLYPECQTFKYPKAGEDNSKVSIHVYDLKSEKTKQMKTPDIEYFPRMKWTKDPNTLCIMALNRLQNKLQILLANAVTGEAKAVYSEENKYYVDEKYFDNLIFLDDNEHFVFTNETSGYNHIYLYDMNGELVNQITEGNWEVTDFIGVDNDKEIVYYASTESSPLQTEIYSIKLNGKKKKKLSTRDGSNTAVFSKGFKYYINYFSDINTPPYITLHNAKGKEIRVLEDNSRLKDIVKQYGGVNKEFFTFKTSENVELNGYMIKPPDFDEKKKYPVFIEQYCGPGSQTVTNSWSFNWYNMLAQKGYIVVSVDPRGTGGRGEEFKKMTYKQLGKYETIDMIETAKYLKKQPYIDGERIGIFGWSYGGFITSLCMTKGADFFKAGIAVAPVTNWRYYDNIYTERFMRTPQENPEGYDNNSPIHFADQLKGKYLIVHGMGDDNVHLQNSVEFVERLVQADKQFEMFYYTNRNHSIYGGNTRTHLFKKMTNFILENL